MRWVTLCLQSGPWPLYTGHSTFCSSIQIRFPPSPLHSFTSARPGRRAKPTLATPLSVDCQCLATVTLTVATQHFTLLSASQRKKGYWWLLLFASLSSLILKQIWTTYSNFADEIVKRRKRGGGQSQRTLDLFLLLSDIYD